MQRHLKIKIHVTCTWNELLPYCSISFNLCNVAGTIQERKLVAVALKLRQRMKKLTTVYIMTLNLVLLCYFAKDSKEIYQICNARAVYCFCHEMN